MVAHQVSVFSQVHLLPRMQSKYMCFDPRHGTCWATLLNSSTVAAFSEESRETEMGPRIQVESFSTLPKPDFNVLTDVISVTLLLIVCLVDLISYVAWVSCFGPQAFLFCYLLNRLWISILTGYKDSLIHNNCTFTSF
jgi:hypothetical protein